jgi:excisionase family DNA binding protein
LVSRAGGKRQDAPRRGLRRLSWGPATCPSALRERQGQPEEVMSSAEGGREPASVLRGNSVSQTTIPRLALSPGEAAAALGVSRDYFDEHVMPELRVVRRGRKRLVPMRELERWLDIEAARALQR